MHKVIGSTALQITDSKPPSLSIGRRNNHLTRTAIHLGISIQTRRLVLSTLQDRLGGGWARGVGGGGGWVDVRIGYMCLNLICKL